MSFIRTVLGDIQPDQLNCTLIHEHLIKDWSHISKDNDAILIDSPELVSDITLAKQAGCDALVEVTNRGMGRNPMLLADLSKRLGLHVICATGFYKEKVYPTEVFEKSREEICQIFIDDILSGIEGTGIKAGILSEIGSSFQEVTKAEEKVFRSVCDAHKLSGAPISTHCELGTMGIGQLRIFESEGIDLAHVSFGHQDLNRDLDEQVTLIKAGAFIQFDTIGKNSYRTHEERLNNLLSLLDKGYEDNLMLSGDLTRKSYFRVNGGPGYVYLFDTFLPDLRIAGVTDSIIDKMLVQNPRRFLTFSK